MNRVTNLRPIAIIVLIIVTFSCGQSKPRTHSESTEPTKSVSVTQPTTPVHLPVTVQWEQWNFVIHKADIYTSLDDGKVKPKKGLFLALVGELENNSEDSECWTTTNWKLTNAKTREKYDFSFYAATPLKSIYNLDIPGVLFGTCVNSGEKQPLFVVFDVDQDAELALTLYEGQPIELFTANYLANVPTATPTNTPPPTNTPNPTDTPVPTDTSVPTNTSSIPTDTPMSSSVSTSVTESTSTPPSPPVCPNPQVQINSPAPGTPFTSRYVSISGNANIPNFSYYKFEYSTDPNSSNWNYLLRQDTPIENGQLMELDTTTIPKGPYGLRLTVVDQTGNYPEPCVVWFNTLDSSEVTIPTIAPSQPLPTAAPPPAGGNSGGWCCKHCGPNSQPCGESCISLSKTCHKGAGCACY
jgi:hypothetical protein